MNLKVKKLVTDAKLPVREHPTDSGADVFANNIKRIYIGKENGEICITSKNEDFEEYAKFPLTLNHGERALIGTGLSATVEEGYEIQVRSRSGVALKQGMKIGNAPGTIDFSYTGEIGIILVNDSLYPQPIEKGAKIAQLVVAKVELLDIIEVDELNETDRGDGGFGSTGK